MNLGVSGYAPDLLNLSLFGIPLRPSEAVPVGVVCDVDGSWVMHPLDIIAVAHQDDPHTRLDAAITYLTVRAIDEFDRAERWLGYLADAFEAGEPR